MEEDTGLGVFVGMMAALAIFLILALISSRPTKLNTVESIEHPVYVFSITIDEETFTCRDEPMVTTKGVVLADCKELFGDYVRIQNYKSFSFRAVNVE